MNLKEPISYKLRPNENKNSNASKVRDYEDEQQSLALKGSDSLEVRDLKAKIRTVMVKLANSKKEKESLQKENSCLSEEVVDLQGNLRQMIAGFSNTSSNFPIPHELTTKIAQFYKCDCNDKFFDIMGQELLNVKGMIFFFLESFKRCQKLITTYLYPALNCMETVGCFQTLEGPVMNVLRKAFQTTHIKILDKIVEKGELDLISRDIHKILGMAVTSASIVETRNFLTRVTEILLCCTISDPPFTVAIEEIGRKVCFNSFKHDPIDGFLKAKEQCWIVLPEIRRSNQELVSRSLVLQLDYDDLIN